MGAFVDLRDNAKFLATVFEPFNRWVRRLRLRGAALDCVTESQIHSWRADYQSLLMQGAVCEVCLPPGPFCRGSPLVTHSLTWCESVVPQTVKFARATGSGKGFRHTSEALPLPSTLVLECRNKNDLRFFAQLTQVPAEDQKRYRSRSVRCYLAVIRGIRRWLIARHYAKQLDTNLYAPLEFEACRIVRVKGCDVCEIAYLLMRFFCEVDPARLTILSRPARPQGVYRWEYASLIEAETLRRASRAGYLALYGTLVLVINLMKVNGLFDLRCLPSFADLEAALSVSYSTDYLRHIGAVLMPQVEDLLESFPSITPGISVSWAKEWASLQLIARRHSSATIVRF